MGCVRCPVSMRGLDSGAWIECEARGKSWLCPHSATRGVTQLGAATSCTTEVSWPQSLYTARRECNSAVVSCCSHRSPYREPGSRDNSLMLEFGFYSMYPARSFPAFVACWRRNREGHNRPDPGRGGVSTPDGHHQTARRSGGKARNSTGPAVLFNKSRHPDGPELMTHPLWSRHQ